MSSGSGGRSTAAPEDPPLKRRAKASTIFESYLPSEQVRRGLVGSVNAGHVTSVNAARHCLVSYSNGCGCAEVALGRRGR